MGLLDKCMDFIMAGGENTKIFVKHAMGSKAAFIGGVVGLVLVIGLMAAVLLPQSMTKIKSANRSALELSAAFEEMMESSTFEERQANLYEKGYQLKQEILGE